MNGERVGVHEEVVWRRPFCRLVHFVRDLPAEDRARNPRILLVAPMSGHFATLLRGTVETLLPNHEVFITDWQDARGVPLGAGGFDLDDYIVYMRELFAYFGGDVHVFAVCQPAVPVLAAIALMEEDGDPAVPLSMILAGGPIDTRVSPTVVNKLAQERGTNWFRRNVITRVPWPNLGYGRNVYPGFLQLTGFMTMNLDRHVNKHRDFYDEYLAVMDLTEEFYLQTVDTVFVRHALPRSEMTHYGRRIDLSAIRRVALMTVEGEKDDITGLGQCAAAHELCANIPADNKRHFECPGVGHYGIFNGSRFRTEIAPRIGRFVRRHDPRTQSVRELALMERDVATARASGHSYELAAAAFSFSAANDSAPDRMARRLKSQGLGSIEPKQEDSEPSQEGLHVAQFRLMALAGSLFLDGLFRLHKPAGLRGTTRSHFS